MNEKLPETALEKAQMPDLAEKDFKEAFAKVFKELMQFPLSSVFMIWIKTGKDKTVEDLETSPPR